MLRSARLPEYLFEEIKTLAETRFNYAEKRPADSYVSAISDAMQRPWPPHHLLTGGSLLYDWDEPRVRALLEQMTLSNGRIIVMGRDFRPIGQHEKEWQVEPWYKTPFLVERTDEETLRAAIEPNDIQELFLPVKNEFMPENLSIDKIDVRAV